jgi:hypothetical protein
MKSLIRYAVKISIVALVLFYSGVAFWPTEAATTFVSSNITGDNGISRGVAVGDIDGDGDIDLYTTNDSGQQNYLWINSGTGTFSGNNITGDTGNSSAAYFGDLDGDNDLDLYVTNTTNQQNKIWINDGNGNFTANNITGDTGSSYGVVMGDVDGDGDLDIYVANYSSQQNKLWINSGNATFTASDITGDTGNSFTAVMGDVDGDDDLDIYVANDSGGQNKLWINDGNGNFTADDITGDTGNSSGAVMGDVDGDGDLDIYVGNYNNTQNKLWINDGNGNFTADDITGDEGWTRGVDMGDVDGDGDLDIYVATDGNALNIVWVNDGLGNFTSDSAGGDLGNTQDVEMFDADGDGDEDLYASNYSNQANRLWLNRSPILNYSGNFTESLADDGVVDGSRIITINEDTFVNSGGTLILNTHYTASNVPSGLTPVMTVSGGGTSTVLTFSGNASLHGDAQDVSDLEITFLSGAFTTTATSTDVNGYTNSSGVIDFFGRETTSSGGSYVAPPQCLLGVSAPVYPGDNVLLNLGVDWPSEKTSIYYYRVSDDMTGARSYEGVYPMGTKSITIPNIQQDMTISLSAQNTWGATVCSVPIILQEKIEEEPEQEITEPEDLEQEFVEEPEQVVKPEPLVCEPYLKEHIHMSHENNPKEVQKLEMFLNEFEHESLEIDGVYDRKDFRAVIRFQEKYMEEVLFPWKLITQGTSYTYAPNAMSGFLKRLGKGTGYVYISTTKQINSLYCERFYAQNGQVF